MHTQGWRAKGQQISYAHSSGGELQTITQLCTLRGGELKKISQLYTLRSGELKNITQLWTLRGGKLKTITQLCTLKSRGEFKNTTELTHDLSRCVLKGYNKKWSEYKILFCNILFCNIIRCMPVSHIIGCIPVS